MALSCELCGHTEFLKQDGVFVCQGCGTKYTLEEARKLMAGFDFDNIWNINNNYPYLKNINYFYLDNLEIPDKLELELNRLKSFAFISGLFVC